MKIILPPLLTLLSIFYIVIQVEDIIFALIIQLSILLIDSSLLLIPHVLFLGGSFHTRLNLLRAKIILLLIGNIFLIISCAREYNFLPIVSPLTMIALLSSFLKLSKIKRIFFTKQRRTK